MAPKNADYCTVCFLMLYLGSGNDLEFGHPEAGLALAIHAPQLAQTNYLTGPDFNFAEDAEGEIGRPATANSDAVQAYPDR